MPSSFRTPHVTRRTFLAAAGGVVLLAACGSDDSSKGSSASTTADEPKAGLTSGRLSSDLYASTEPQRFAFALQKDEQFYGGPPATIAFAAVPPEQDEKDPEPPRFGPPIPAQYRPDGLPDNRGIYTVEAVFATPGVWKGNIDVDGQKTEIFFQVADQPTAPTAGTPAPVVPSPTVADPLGTDPLCTRTDANNDPAPCDLHTQNLVDITGKGRPVAVMFATPARCQSQFCGPVLDQLLALQPEYQDRVDMVHVEIYQSDRGTALVPTLDGWGIMSEPWIFVIDGAGTIQGRLDGAFSTSEIRGLLDRVA